MIGIIEYMDKGIKKRYIEKISRYASQNDSSIVFNEIGIINLTIKRKNIVYFDIADEIMIAIIEYKESGKIERYLGKISRICSEEDNTLVFNEVGIINLRVKTENLSYFDIQK